MRRSAFAVLFVAAGLGTAHAADDADNPVTIAGGLDFGFKHLNLVVGSQNGQGGGGSFSPSYVTIIPSIALAYRSFYASVLYDKSISADPGIGSDQNGAAATLLDFSRTDTTYTLGYRIAPSISVFGGITNGDNQFTETSVSSNVLVVKEISYVEKGPFIGTSYNHGFGEKGTLTLSVGYAKLKGELDIITHGGGKPDQISKGDNTGLSYGATWSGPLSGALNYRVGVKLVNYKMKAGDDNPQDITEKYRTYFVGLVNYF